MRVEIPSPLEKPWGAGLAAVRANAIPALIVQAGMVAVLFLYWFYPPTTRWLDGIALIKERAGYGFSAVVAIVAGAVLPELLRVMVFQKMVFKRINLKNLVFTIPYWGATGMIVDLFYRAQGDWFGEDASFRTIACKVVVDQFIYNPLFAAPVSAWFYDWKNSGYRIDAPLRLFTRRYYQEVIVPILVATWGMWLPIVSVIYALPGQLQVPLFALALTLWVILFTWITEQRSIG